MGSGARHEQLALGEPPNLAARLEGLATPNTVVISAATWSLVHEYFTYHDLGTHVLKGVATPVHVYRVPRESGVQTLLRLAQHVHDPALCVIAHHALGATWFHLGALPSAHMHLKEGITLYTPE